MNMSAQNLEDATGIATEFISSLDNLPQEVQFLLKEIQYKDLRSQELHQRIHVEQAMFVKNGLTPDTAATRQAQNDLTVPWQAIPARIASAFNELHKLSAEKTELAERLVQLIHRVQARLEVDLTRVRVLQGEITSDGIDNGTYSVYGTTSSSARRSRSQYDSVPTANTLVSGPSGPLNRKSAMTTNDLQDESPNKRRRLDSRRGSPAIAGNANLTPVAIPTLPNFKGTEPGLSRGPSRSQTRSSTPQAQTRSSARNSSRSRLRNVLNFAEDDDEDDPDLDAEGDDDPDLDAEGDPDEEDTTLYCICNKTSYGEMIMCDNPSCQYQWFHLPCVGLKAVDENSNWYCPECTRAGFSKPTTITLPSSEGRKSGRKK